MKISISATPSFKNEDGSDCFSIFITEKEAKRDNISNLKKNWSLYTFPLKDELNSSLFSHRKYMDNILSYKKEIGYYCASRDFLSIDRDLLYHYIFLGSEIHRALKRILLRLLPEMADFKKITFRSLCSTNLELINNSPLIERTEKLLNKSKSK
ncbi:hypothetical protein [Mycoplasma parvum]|uniref:Uncharacterized protein n=1 Tax=Mycoplasma parvum str. Indiana TaxID=1403316 RepID=U5NCL7_9MOLU|nr:hypothetical protein [Mycoplasma parvum]AGX89070.1 hypothetical protein PRV_01565 [Mycoplasma parvum str. Indiana]